MRCEICNQSCSGQICVDCAERTRGLASEERAARVVDSLQKVHASVLKMEGEYARRWRDDLAQRIGFAMSRMTNSVVLDSEPAVEYPAVEPEVEAEPAAVTATLAQAPVQAPKVRPSKGIKIRKFR